MTALDHDHIRRVLLTGRARVDLTDDRAIRSHSVALAILARRAAR